jgi:hypothetical protein
MRRHTHLEVPASVLIPQEVFNIVRHEAIQPQLPAPDTQERTVATRNKENSPVTITSDEQQRGDQPPSSASSHQPETTQSAAFQGTEKEATTPTDRSEAKKQSDAPDSSYEGTVRQETLSRIDIRRTLEERLKKLQKGLSPDGEHPTATSDKELRNARRHAETIPSRDQSDISLAPDTKDQRASEKIDELNRIPEQEATATRRPAEQTTARPAEIISVLSENRQNVEVTTDDLNRAPDQIHTPGDSAQSLYPGDSTQSLYSEQGKNLNEYMKYSEKNTSQEYNLTADDFIKQVDMEHYKMQILLDQAYSRKMDDLQSKNGNSDINYEKHALKLQEIIEEYKRKSSELLESRNKAISQWEILHNFSLQQLTTTYSDYQYDIQEAKKVFAKFTGTGQTLEINQRDRRVQAEIRRLLDKIKVRAQSNGEIMGTVQTPEINQRYARIRVETRRLFNKIEARTQSNKEILRLNDQRRENNKKREKF